MSEKANDLLNKFGSAQFDFMIWNTPDNLVARDKARQEIYDYIAELEAAQRWIPVSEPPKIDGTYLVRNICTDVYSCNFIADTNTWVLSWYDSITHWMPLPELPEAQESEATSCKFCGSNKSDIRMNSIVCTSCGRKIGNIAPPEVQE